METNNTSCFNFKKILNKNKYSNHAYVLAIDINPLYNPYVIKEDNKIFILPQNSLKYVDRTKDFDYKIDENDLILVGLIGLKNPVEKNIKESIKECKSANIRVFMLTGNTIISVIHILYIDLVADTLPSITLAFEGSSTDIMKRKPNGLNKRIFTNFFSTRNTYKFIYLLSF